MKNSRLKKAAAILLTAATIASTSAIAPITVNAAGLSYAFTGDEMTKPGYAEGTITLSGVADGSYYLYWADDKNALDGYYEIAEIQVKGGKGTFAFGENTAIPIKAKKLIATSSLKKTAVSDAIAVYDIPKEKVNYYSSENQVYSFMSYSDIHIDTAKNQYYPFAEMHFKKALETAADRKADFIITSGDNINNAEGPNKEFDKFQEILADSPFTNPIYESSGNHELRTGRRKSLLSSFATATGLDGSRETIDKNLPYYTIEEPTTGDLFIFMALEFSYDPKTADEFSDKQLDWLEETLKEHYGKNKNIYLIQHALIEGYGAGDDPYNYYKVPLNTQYNSTVRFRDIIEAHPDIIWISGHTHIAFKYGYNYSNMNDTSCHMIHNSSVCCPTMLNYNSHNLSYTAHDDEGYSDMTEGYYVQVFPDAVMFSGENLYHNKIYPASCYMIEAGRSSLEKTEDSKSQEKTTTFPYKGQMAALAAQVIEIPKSFNPDAATASDLNLLVEKSKVLLAQFYPFSSYDKYQTLKRNAFNADENNVEKSYKALSEAYVDFLPYTYEGDISLYFVNTKGWDKVYAHLWSAKNDSDFPGEEMENIGTNAQGFPVYKLDVNFNRYKQVQFSNGTETEISEEQSLTGKNNQMITVNEFANRAPYYCFAGEFKGLAE